MSLNGDHFSDGEMAELSDLEDETDRLTEDRIDAESDENVDNLPYPGFVAVALRYINQSTMPRNWCLNLITNPYPF